MSAELFQEFGLSDSQSAVDDVEVVTRRLECRLESLQFIVPIVERHSLHNDYLDNEYLFRDGRVPQDAGQRTAKSQNNIKVTFTAPEDARILTVVGRRCFGRY